MRVPFTSPNLKELDALSAEKRASVLRRYAESAISLRAISALKRLFFMAIGFAIAGGVALGFIDDPLAAHRPIVPIAIGCFTLSLILVVAAITAYRRLTQSTLRGIISEYIRE
jgi:hypothetical protein